MSISEENPRKGEELQGVAETNQKQAPPAALTSDQATNMSDKLDRLEKVVRGIARENLTISRSQREVQSAFESLQGQVSDLELSLKGVSQSVWRATQESSQALQNAEEHYAGAIRELEKRVREEIQWQTNRSSMKAILPALDDLDLVLAHQAKLSSPLAPEDSFQQAVKQVRRKLVEGLRTLGFEEIPIQIGATKFDPEVHEAMDADIPAQLFADAEAQPGAILFVRRAGFIFQGRVFRVPQVIVKS